MNFKDMKIGTRLGFAFGLVLLVTIIAAVLTLSKVADIQDNLREIVTDNNVKVRLSTEMAESTHIIARVIRTAMLVKDKAQREQRRKSIDDQRAIYNKLWAELEKFPPSEKGKAIRKKISDARSVAGALNNKVIELAMADKDSEATELLIKEAAPAIQKMIDALDENIAFQQADTEKLYADAVVDYQSTRNLLIGANTLVVLLAALSGWLVTRSIVKPLKLAVQAADDVAAGKLDGKLPAAGNDETGQLLQSFSKMQGVLAQFQAAQTEMARQHEAGICLLYTSPSPRD